MERYDSYKDSGVEWIGEIPRHWAETKLKNLGNVTLGKMLTNEDRGGFSLRPYLRSFNVQVERVDVSDIKEMWFSEKEMSELRLLKGDLLFNEGGDVGRTSIWDDEMPECYIQNSVNRVRIKGNSRYFLYVSGLHHYTGYYDSQVNRVSIPHLTKEKLENTLFPSPPLHEQERIVEYLDRKTALIDSLIEKTVRKIELLREKRTALINHVVTKGLNPDVEMKDSGVEWIGEIPRHWEMTPLKRVVKIGNGKDYKHLEVEFGGFPVFGTGGEFARCSDYLHSGPSVLLGRKGTIDNPLFVTEPFWTSDTIYYTVICEDKIQPKLLFHLVRLIPFSLFSYGSAIPSMTKTDYLEMRFPIPPLHEQERIVEYLDEQTSIIDSTIATEERRIELLKEYRQSLISEVVTGKVKVTRDE